MVSLTRLNGTPVTVNATHVVWIESTPDTLLSLHNGDRILVRESLHEVGVVMTNFYRKVGLAPSTASVDRSEEQD